MSTLNSLGEEKEEIEEKDPIFSFPNLKNSLAKMGIQIGQAGTWRSVGTIEVLPEDIGERIFFEEGGIFYIDDDGIKRRGFMYKAKFYFEYKGRKRNPKFHVYNCEAIKNFGKDAYRFDNSEPIMVYSRNAQKEVKVEGMELCGYCKKLLQDKEAKLITDSKDFVEFLKESGETKEPTEYDVDVFGYVKNWEEISLAFRTKKQFTCERCGTQVEDGLDRVYIHTHHKNGSKTDNRESNLECLCIKCHSEVDEKHRKNYSSAANRVLIEEYIRKYHSKSTEAE